MEGADPEEGSTEEEQLASDEKGQIENLRASQSCNFEV